MAMVHLPAGDLTNAATQDREAADANCTMGFPMASKTTPALVQSRQWGRIEVLPSAVGAIAGHAALRCYGISGMAARGLRDGVAALVRRGTLDRRVAGSSSEG